ncbi:hypothetical protein WDV06_04455 [Streptomyces racemochromogenes]|uniref:Secreted protein n=1 Tax=Streptomyces racemochromogenes TaxID=67353 RepID=A0ABW7P8F8_9ACTN
MSVKGMSVRKKAVAAAAMAAGLALAHVGAASAAGYPERFDVHFLSGDCRTEGKFSYTGGVTTNKPTWVASAVRSGEPTCNVYVGVIYKSPDCSRHPSLRSDRST